MKIRVYIASPYTIGDISENVRNQMSMGATLMSKGFYPFIPLLMHYQDIVFPNTYEYWMEYDLVWLDACDCVLRMAGRSEGADIEVNRAEKLGKPVFCSLSQLLSYYDAKIQTPENQS